MDTTIQTCLRYFVLTCLLAGVYSGTVHAMNMLEHDAAGDRANKLNLTQQEIRQLEPHLDEDQRRNLGLPSVDSSSESGSDAAPQDPGCSSAAALHPPKEGCECCALFTGSNDGKDGVLYRDDNALVTLERGSHERYTDACKAEVSHLGHCAIVPRQHASQGLDGKAMPEVEQLIERTKRILAGVYWVQEVTMWGPYECLSEHHTWDLIPGESRRKMYEAEMHYHTGDKKAFQEFMQPLWTRRCDEYVRLKPHFDELYRKLHRLPDDVFPQSSAPCPPDDEDEPPTKRARVNWQLTGDASSPQLETPPAPLGDGGEPKPQFPCH